MSSNRWEQSQRELTFVDWKLLTGQSSVLYDQAGFYQTLDLLVPHFIKVFGNSIVLALTASYAWRANMRFVCCSDSSKRVNNKRISVSGSSAGLVIA
jgi:hypothetical protein